MSALYDFIRNHLQALAASGILPQPFEYEFVINALLCAVLIGPLLGGWARW